MGLKKCSIYGCDKEITCKLMCGMHYTRIKRLGTSDLPIRQKTCSFIGCNKKTTSKLLCRSHYRKLPEVRAKELQYNRSRYKIPEVRVNMLKSGRKYSQKIKNLIINHYSGGTNSCSCCGESTTQLLTLEHPNGGGTKERILVGGTSKLYQKLIKDNFPPGYDILCISCNWARGVFGYCPHQLDVKRFTGGFGFKRDENGKLLYKQHIFGRKIGKNVEIGRFTNIDIGSWRDTEIGEGSKLDSLVHIGHNVKIASNVLVVSGSIIGGSTEIGDFSYIGMNSSIRDHIKIGKHVIIGAGSVVINDVKDYDIVAGNPAKSIKDKIKLTLDARFQMAGY